MNLYIAIIGIVTAASIAGSLLFFGPTSQENLQICASLHDDISSLLPEKDMVKTGELVNKYASYKCYEKIDQWDDLAKYNVVIPT